MSKKAKGIIGCIIVIIFILIAAGIIELYFYHTKRHPSTEDAHIQSHFTKVASLVDGRVITVNVHPNDNVKQDELLFALDPTPYQLEANAAEAKIKLVESKVRAAKSAIKAAAAQVSKAQIELALVKNQTQKITSLAATGDVPRIEAEKAKAKLAASGKAYQAAVYTLQQNQDTADIHSKINPELKAATAEYKAALYKLNHTKYYAPYSGIITNLKLSKGDLVATGRPLFVLIDPSNYWIDANFPEKRLPRIKTGQPASITCNLYPGATLKGKVSSINNSSTASFSLLPSEGSGGNWVKTTQRFDVIISINQADQQKHHLRMGASCEVTINTTE
jgi:membrane fusion protein, multidrug efflux system